MCIEKAMKTYLGVENTLNFICLYQRAFLECLEVCGGDFEKMQEAFNVVKKSPKSLFDFDFSDPNDPQYNYNLMLAALSIPKRTIVEPKTNEFLSRHPILQLFQNPKHQKLAKEMVHHIFRMCDMSCIGIDWIIPTRDPTLSSQYIDMMLIGDAICSFGSLLSHSCIPNIDRQFVENKYVYIVRLLIRKDQELTMTNG
jgi:hypothetical protein